MKMYLKNKKGFAIIEFSFLIFVLLFSIVLIFGSWGITRSAVLHSIAARSYLWADINQRDNALFLKDTKDNRSEILQHVYWSLGSRFYTVVDSDANEIFIPPGRKIDIGGSDWSDSDSEGWLNLKNQEQKYELYGSTPSELDLDTGNLQEGIFERNQRYRKSVVFLRMGYGICISSACQVCTSSSDCEY